MMGRIVLSILVLLAAACKPTSARLATSSRLARDPSGAPGAILAWGTLDAGTFARARAERRLLLIDGSAEWCHWCHVMEATTYHDPEVRRLIDARFIAVKVDVDAHPDFEERYQDWGWPATVLMTADGVEIGKYKGYVEPARFAEILRAAAAEVPREGGREAPSAALPMTERQIATALSRARQQLDALWDAEQGSWGHGQKVPLHWENAWTLAQARAGDGTARERVLFTLDRQSKIIDPVWGGICQYSTDGDWLHPHHEKLGVFQSGAIDDYANAFTLTRDEKWLRLSRLVRGFVDRFLTSPEGGFYAAMDADLNAHDSTKTYVTGHDYYGRTDEQRRALGIPRVDVHEYGRENGLAIAAHVTFFEASGDATALAAADRAADRLMATHATSTGGITHGTRDDADVGTVLYLADNAAFGFGLARLYEATHVRARLDQAKRVADFMVGNLFDAQDGGFFANGVDPNAVGTLAIRRKPFEHNVMAVRFLAKLARLLPTDAYRGAIAHTLPVITAPEAVEDHGRMIGDLLLALDETRGVR